MFILYIALFRHFIWKDGEVSADKHLPSHTNGLTQALTKICSLLGKILPQQDLCVCVFATAQKSATADTSISVSSAETLQLCTRPCDAQAAPKLLCHLVETCWPLY